MNGEPPWQEADRASLYLDSSTRKLLIAKAEGQLLKPHTQVCFREIQQTIICTTFAASMYACHWYCMQQIDRVPDRCCTRESSENVELHRLNSVQTS